MKLDAIKEIKKLKLENGDVLIIRTEDKMLTKLANDLHKEIKNIIDKNVLLLLVPDGYDLEKMKHDDAIMLLNRLIELKKKN